MFSTSTAGPGNEMTMESLVDAMVKLSEITPPDKIFEKVIVTKQAYTMEGNFPASKNRSDRVHKKLLKRHGLKKVPGIVYVKATGLTYIHPEIVDQMDRATDA